jgi:hypothetical protein
MSENGWEWFAETKIDQPVGDIELARIFAKSFGGRDGDRALAHLKSLTLDRYLGPEASDSQLRHLEGQRHLVNTILALVARGRSGG